MIKSSFSNKDEPSFNSFSLPNDDNLRNNASERTSFYKEIDKNYTVENEMFGNHLGKVYKVRLKSNDEVRCMFKIRHSKLSAEKRAGLDSQMKHLKELESPHLVKLLDFYIEEESNYLITEFCECGFLHEKIQQNSQFKTAFSENQVRYIITQLLKSVEFLSAKGFVHTDIRPQNILIYNITTENDELMYDIKLLNFGSSLKNHDLIHNVPYYISPEILDKRYFSNTDIWSCGIIMYELLYGRTPFAGGNSVQTEEEGKSNRSYKSDKLEEVYKRIRSCDISFDSGGGTVSDAARNLLKKMLVVNPDERYDVEDCLNDTFIQKSPSSKIKSHDAKSAKVSTEDRAVSKDNNGIMEISSSSCSNKKGSNSNNSNSPPAEEARISFLVSKTIKFIRFYIKRKFIKGKEMKRLSEIFDGLDTGRKGELSYQKIYEGFLIYLGKSKDSLKELEIEDKFLSDFNINEGDFSPINQSASFTLNKEKFSKFVLMQKKKRIKEDLNKAFNELLNSSVDEIMNEFKVVNSNLHYKKYIVFFDKLTELLKEAKERDKKTVYLYNEYENLVIKSILIIVEEKKKVNNLKIMDTTDNNGL